MPSPSPNGSAARIANILRTAPLFRGMPPALVQELSALATRATFASGDAVWHAGDIASCFTLIEHGLVAIQRTMPSGEEVILGLFGPGESIGDSAAIAGCAYPASAMALSHLVEVVRVPATTVLCARDSNLAVAQSVQRALLQHTEILQAKINVVSAGGVSARLAALYLHLAERFGDEDEDGATRIGVSLSRVCLARLVSARVETVIRILSAWEKQRLMHTDHDGFLIPDLDSLRAAAREG